MYFEQRAGVYMYLHRLTI